MRGRKCSSPDQAHRLRLPVLLAAAAVLLFTFFPAEAQQPKLVIAEAELTGASQLPELLRAEVVTGLKGRAFATPSALSDYADFAVRSMWQDHGYFRVKVSIEPKVIREDAGQRLVAVKLRVDEGRQYWLGSLRFAKHTVFPDDTLRGQFPMRAGDIFNVAQVRRGLEAIRKLYASEGYVEALITPILETNDETGEILLRLELEEGPKKT